ncbi:MAG TPA: hypothetical protein VLY04_25930 [Bryobacteraceae bacterium]|nr:hypothetical protein [Bryobacteraceae bacterium]
MQYNIVRKVFFLATLMLSMAAVASAQYDGTCSNASVAGTWGYTETGTLYLPTGAIPYASVGSYTLDIAGSLSGARTASAGGNIITATVKGTATVNPDCTGTLTVGFYDKSGNLQNTAVKAVVYVDNAKQALTIITTIFYPNGLSLTAVLTTDAKKVFSSSILGWR